jgi:NAD(P)H-hydrate epimerase
MEKASSLIFGPGMGHSDATVQAAREFMRVIGELGNKPAVIDADGLNALSDIDTWWSVDAPIVLTPHPGEMSRLTGMSIPDIQRDRLEIARRFATKWRKVVVLKGAATVVAAPSGEVSINSTGGPNLATAGTGDVLSGTIGGLLAQGLAPKEAAIVGVYVHGFAGDILRETHGDAGTIASDLWTALPVARRAILEEAESDQ